MGYFSLGSLLFALAPTEIRYGGDYLISRHNLIGGNRAFDIMGTNPEDIVFSGQFWGPNKFTDRDSLQAMVGTSQILIWGKDSYSVIVQKASCEQDFTCVKYTVTCGIQINHATNTTVAPLTLALTAVSTANSLTLPASVSTSLTAASTALTGTPDTQSALTSLTAAQTALTGSIASSDTTLSSFDPSIAAGSMTVPAFSSGLLASVAAANARVQASQANALVTTAIFNIGS